jgi:hypothetical protein
VAGTEVGEARNALGARRLHVFVVAVTVLVLSVPYGVAGPNLLADDWVYARNGVFKGVLHSSGPRQVQRPGAALLYDATFGLIGPHPLRLYVVQVALWVLAAVALLIVACRFTSPGRALAIALVWAVLPTHSSLEHWASTSQALLALILLCGGIYLLDTALSVRREVAAVVVLIASMLTYEVVAAAAVAAFVAVPLWRRRSVSRPALVAAVALFAAAFAWLLAHRTVYPDNRGRIDLSVAVRTLFSVGLEPATTAGKLVTALIVITIAVAIWRVAARTVSVPDALVVAGTGVVLLGLVPLWEFSTNLLGMYDRLTVVSGVGVTIICIGGVGMAQQALRNRQGVLVVSAFALALIAVPQRADRNRDYIDAGNAAIVEAHRLANDTAPNESKVIDGPIAEIRGLSGLSDGWNTTAAVQLAKHDPSIRIYVDLNGQRTGA